MGEESRLIVDEARPAQQQMQTDVQLAQDALPTVRFFTWNPPAISLGFKQQPPVWLEETRWRNAGLEMVERPTGGGIAFHGSDVSISVVAPRRPGASAHALMSAVCESAVRLCGAYGLEATSVLAVPGAVRVDYCLTQPSSYAVLLSGRKIAGFALRRFPDSWLVQGSLLVRPLPERLAGALPHEVLEGLAGRAVSLSEAVGMPIDEEEIARRWAAQWRDDAV